MQLPETAAECLVLVPVDILIAEEYDLMVQQRLVNFGIGLVAQWLPQVYAGNFRAQYRAYRCHRDGFIGHVSRSLFPCRWKR